MYYSLTKHCGISEKHFVYSKRPLIQKYFNIIVSVT